MGKRFVQLTQGGGMKPAELIEVAQTLDSDKEILCQVVGSDGSAWNCFFEFTPNKITEFNLLTVSHEEIETLRGADTTIKTAELYQRKIDEVFSLERIHSCGIKSGRTFNLSFQTELLKRGLCLAQGGIHGPDFEKIAHKYSNGYPVRAPLEHPDYKQNGWSNGSPKNTLIVWIEDMEWVKDL